MILGIDPKVDFVFKRIFGLPQNREILVDIINAVRRPKPGHEVVEVTLLNPFNEKDFEDSKLSIVDVKATDQSGRQFNIEMEMAPDRYFGKRVLYYWAKRHADQLHEGESYEDLKKTVIIAFVNASVFRTTPDYRHAFTIHNADNTLTFTDDFEAHILEIEKFNRQPDNLADPLDAWLFFLKHGEGLDSAALPNLLQTPSIQRAVKELMMLTKEERERYESRLRAQRDEVSRIRSAKLDGLEEGRADGLCDAIVSLAKSLGRPALKQDFVKLSPAELQTLHERLLAEVAAAISRATTNGKNGG